MENHENEGILKMQGEETNKVEEFKCLGLTAQADGASEREREVMKRIQAGWGSMEEEHLYYV